MVKAFDFLILLVAFLYGNIFTIQFSNLGWGFISIFFIIGLIEFLNQLLYLKNIEINLWPITKVIKIYLFDENKEKQQQIKIILNTIKRGFILGFFIEAFKVGS